MSLSRISLINEQTNCSSHLSSKDLRGGRPRETAPKNNIIQKVLEDLWIGIAKPILDAIGFERLPSIQRRIWWCTTGPLTFLPLHAAGIYNRQPGTSICVSDFAVSSYIPNVTTLIDMVKKPAHPPSNGSLLLVSQAKAPTLRHIPGADREVKKLFEMMQEAKIKAVRISGKDATVSRVKEEMAMHRNVHLACHAEQDVKSPLKSRFYLLDGQLELFKILEQKFPNADMAFLSACQTSTGVQLISEEVVHLAAGMLAAGYRSIVATMWSISDPHAPDISEVFYSRMLSKESVTGNAKEIRGESSMQLDGARAAYAMLSRKFDRILELAIRNKDF